MKEGVKYKPFRPRLGSRHAPSVFEPIHEGSTLSSMLRRAALTDRDRCETFRHWCYLMMGKSCSSSRRRLQPFPLMHCHGGHICMTFLKATSARGNVSRGSHQVSDNSVIKIIRTCWPVPPRANTHQRSANFDEILINYSSSPWKVPGPKKLTKDTSTLSEEQGFPLWSKSALSLWVEP